MSFLFKKKPKYQAIAELLEDGEALFKIEMSKKKYNSYSGKEPTVDILVNVQPEYKPSFEAHMQAGSSVSFLLKKGVKVLVEYTDGKKGVKLTDEVQAILDRNPQLRKQGD